MGQESLKSYPPLAPMDESALDVNTSYAHILRFIEGAPKVVDFGCGPGNLARFLAQRGCSVVGVEINPESAGLAREYCADVLIADLEIASPLKLFPTERFDVVIFADILEHLRKPERLLSEAARILRPGGFVIASIPNVAHGAIRLAMLQGQFNYQEIGILDETHLRFFTRETVEKLFEGAGFFIEEITRTSGAIFGPAGTLVPAVNRDDFADETARKVEADAESQTIQFIIKAAPASSPEARYEATRRKNVSLTARVDELEGKLRAALVERGDQLDRPTGEHFERIKNELHQALLGPDGVESLRSKLEQKSDEVENLRHQIVALDAREQSTNNREKKLADETKKAVGLAAQLKKNVEEQEVTIRGLQAKLQEASKNGEESAAAQQALRSEKDLMAAESLRTAASVEESKKQIVRLKAELLEASKDVEKSAAAQQALRSEKDRIAAENRRACESIEQLETQIVRLESEISIGELDILQTFSTIDEQQGAISKMEREAEAARDDLAQVQMQARSLSTLYKSSEAYRLQLSVEIDDLRGTYAKTRHSHAASLKELEKVRDELAQRESAASAMDRRMLEEEQRFDEAVAELENVRSEFEQRESALNAMDCRMLEEQQRFEEAVFELEKVRSELERAREDATTLASQRERERLVYRNAESQRLQLSIELDDLRSKYKEAKQSHSVACENIERLRGILGEHEDALSAMDRRSLDAERRCTEALAQQGKLLKELAESAGSRARALSEMARAHEAVAELTARCETDEFYLEEMRKSKFWQLRTGWFRVKRAFGIISDVP